MSIVTLNDARIWLDGYDLSGDSNQVDLDWEAETKDRTTFGDNGKRTKAAGLETTMAAVKVFADFAAGDSDAALAAMVGQADKVNTWAVDDVAGSVAYFTRAIHAKRQPLASKVGELTLTDAAFEGSSNEGLLRGQLLLAKVTVSAGASGAGIQVGAVSSGQSVYAALHVFEVTGGGTLTAKVQSDDNSGFTSATDRITFTGATALGAQFGSAAGAITDDYWRVTYTLSAGTATFAVPIAIA